MLSKEKMKAYLAQYYAKNQKKMIQATKERRIRQREFINEFKNLPCTDCHIRYPYYVMDFDHLGDKKFNISEEYECSRERLLAEISKCDVVCSNCHRIRTANRMNKINSLFCDEL